MNIQIPHRRKQSATIKLAGAPGEVFALMCPVREYDWVPGWKTKTVLSNSGLVEPDCIFVTPTKRADAVWITAAHDAAARRLTLYKVIPENSVTRLDIAVEAEEGGSAATISYEHTALGEDGAALVDGHTAAKYDDTMKAWKHYIDAYLAKAA